MSANAAELVKQAYSVRRDGDADVALRLYRQAEGAFGNDAAGRAHCLRHIGGLEREAGRDEEARAALRDAETIYRGKIDDPLSLANTVRLLAVIDDDRERWNEARMLYEVAATATGLDMAPALLECDRRLATREA